MKRFDHDFPYLAEGKVTPHGIYDLQANTGFLTLGTSAETAQFIGSSLKLWWDYRGRYDYAEAREVFLLFDGGGANASRSHQFKLEMLQLAARTGLTLQIAHYPPYSSKWNPIEHRLFPHVTRSIQGIYLEDPETVRQCINERCRTSTGLSARAYVMDRVFSRGQKTEETVPDGYPFVRNTTLPNWNYTCYPSGLYNKLTYLK